MLQFVLTNILMLSLGVMLYLIARTLPRIDEQIESEGILERWIASEIPEKLDNVTNDALSKLLRKLKVYTLKADNTLSDRLKKIAKNRKGDPQEELPFMDELKKDESHDRVE